MPSSVPVGGIRMSVRTASGVVLADGRDELVVARRGADDLDLAVLAEERDRTLPDQVVILREDHAQHARMVPPTGRDG